MACVVIESARAATCGTGRRSRQRVHGWRARQKKRANFEGKRRERVRGSSWCVIAKICDRLSVRQGERRRQTIFEMWLACATQEEIAEAVGLSKLAVSEQIKGCSVLDTWPKPNKLKAVFALSVRQSGHSLRTKPAPRRGAGSSHARVRARQAMRRQAGARRAIQARSAGEGG
jgi:hypothetical protein